jgi:hypothetical protein
MLIAQDRRIKGQELPRVGLEQQRLIGNETASSVLAAPAEMQSSWPAATLARSSFQSGTIRILLNEAQ